MHTQSLSGNNSVTQAQQKLDCHQRWLPVLLMLLLTACGTERGEYVESGSEAMEDGSYEPDQEHRMNFGPDAAQPPAPASAAPGTDAAPARKLLRTASLSIRVDSVDRAARAVTAQLETLGGFVAAERTIDYDGLNRSMTLKVPSERIDEMIGAVEALADKVESRAISVVDKTTEYVDVAARLATQRALAARLEELLERAQKVSEVIEVEREFARVTADIEAFEARLQSIDRDATYATLELQILGTYAPVVSRESFWDDFKESFVDGLRFIRGFALVVVSLWPFWLIAGVLAWWWLRRRRRRVVVPPLR